MKDEKPTGKCSLDPSARAASLNRKQMGNRMTAKLGILAFGSLIDHPGWEIEEAIVERHGGICTPFAVEFARKSRTRSGGTDTCPD
jgi:hypothetical protein